LRTDATPARRRAIWRVRPSWVLRYYAGAAVDGIAASPRADGAAPPAPLIERAGQRAGVIKAGRGKTQRVTLRVDGGLSTLARLSAQ
jgi:hypothetical protein